MRPHIGAPFGENNGKAKLTMEKAKEIRKLYKTGNYGQRGIAKLFGVSQPTIANVLRKKTWSKK